MIKKISGLIISSFVVTQHCWAVTTTAHTRTHSPEIHRWHYSTSIGGGITPRYLGSKSYKATPLLTFSAKYNDYRIIMNGSSAIAGINVSANIVPDKTVNFGPVLVYSLGRDNNTGNRQVNRLTEVKESLFGGFFTSYNFRELLNPYDKLVFRIDMLQDIGNHQQGNVLKLGTNYSTPLSKKVFIATGASLIYGNSDFMQKFYGISTYDAERSGLSAYQAGSGLDSAGVFIMGNYLINTSWSSFISINYSRLLGSANDSPIVQQTGTANQFLAGAGISYRF